MKGKHFSLYFAFIYFDFFFHVLYLQEIYHVAKKMNIKKINTINIDCTNYNSSLFFSKRENMEVYAGATEETSVFDVDTSEPSSTSFPKSFMMHSRNWKRDRKIKQECQK